MPASVGSIACSANGSCGQGQAPVQTTRGGRNAGWQACLALPSPNTRKRPNGLPKWDNKVLDVLNETRQALCQGCGCSRYARAYNAAKERDTGMQMLPVEGGNEW